MVTPWERDLDYARDNASGKYTPVLFWTYQRPVDQADYKSVNFEVKGESEYVRPMNSGKDLYMHVDAISNFGLNIDNVEGFKKGYMIWAYSRSDVQDSAMVVDFQQLPYEVEAKADSSLLALSVLNPEKSSADCLSHRSSTAAVVCNISCLALQSRARQEVGICNCYVLTIK